MGILKIFYQTIYGNKELLFLRVCVLHINYMITRQVMYILCIKNVCQTRLGYLVTYIFS